MVSASTFYPGVYPVLQGINQVSRGYSWLKEKTIRYSVVLESIKIFALNTIYLLSQIFSKSAPLLGKGVLVTLAYTGVEGLPFWVNQFKKLAKDSVIAFKADMKLVACITSLKALVTLSNIGLTVGGFAAALLGLSGFSAAQSLIYAGLAPIGMATILLSVGLLFAYIALNVQALEEVNQMQKFEITPLIRVCLDPATLEELEQKFADFDSSDHPKLIQHLKDHFESQLKYVQSADLALQLIGYFLMAVQKFFTPESVVTAGINWVYSLGWTCKLILEKLNESSLRRSFSEVHQVKAG